MAKEATTSGNAILSGNTIFTTTRLYEFTDTEMQAHDERIRKQDRERIKEKLIELRKDLGTLYDIDIRYFFAQLEKDL